MSMLRVAKISNQKGPCAEASDKRDGPLLRENAGRSFGVAKRTNVRSSEKAEIECNMVRVHPIRGGVSIDQGGEGKKFNGVSCDVFFQLNQYDHSDIFCTTRKLNLTVGVSPNIPMGRFFARIVRNPEILTKEKSRKCYFHGDEDTGLDATDAVKEMLQEFQIREQGCVYEYYSIGIAAEKSFGSYNHRSTSHLEVKFKARDRQNEYFIINMHLSPHSEAQFTLEQSVERFHRCIRLFYSLTSITSRNPVPNLLQVAQSVTISNFSTMGYNISIPSDLVSPKERNSYMVAYKKYLLTYGCKPKSRSFALVPIAEEPQAPVERTPALAPTVPPKDPPPTKVRSFLDVLRGRG